MSVIASALSLALQIAALQAKLAAIEEVYADDV